MNFDGASKGNPGPAGFGIVFRDERGNICNILAGSMGHDTNNSCELWGLLKGIQESSHLGYLQAHSGRGLTDHHFYVFEAFEWL
jgi:ribonuclease HI